MRTLHITISVCAMSIMILLFFNTESLPAQNVSDDGKNRDSSTSVKKPEIFFETPDFDFGKAYKGDKV